MDATEICLLTQEAVNRLLAERTTGPTEAYADCRRAALRWPFPGTVELWLPNDAGVEEIELGTCINMSQSGLGMLLDRELPVGLTLPLAVHQPELSLQGHGVVRHCTEIDAGSYIGVMFLFEECAS